MHASAFRPLAVVACLLLGGGAAVAQSSPYYLGVSQSLGQESNLYRIGGNQDLPLGAQGKSDTVSSTSLVAGVDQTWGRQRLTGSGTWRANRYSKNDHLNNNGYALNLGLDWATIERLSGRLALQADRSLRGFDPAYAASLGSSRNIEDNNLLSGVVRLGVVTRLTAEAAASHRTVRYSATPYKPLEYDQNAASLGLRYRPGGAATVGLAWRQTNLRHISVDNPSKRRDIDLTAVWDPSGLTNVYARISHTSTDHEKRPQSDFSGVTAELRASTQITGKVKLGARLSRELGQGSSSIYVMSLPGLYEPAEFNRVGTALRLTANYQLSAKIALNAGLDHVRRRFDGTVFTTEGSDRTTSLSLGARWLPTRALEFGCNLSHEDRSVSGQNGFQVGNPYAASTFNCYGQFILQ
jgi:hypothetical protein